MLNNTIHITVREDLSEELHLNSEEGMPKYVGAEASVKRIENGVVIRLKDYKGETIETVYEAIESIDFDDGIMTITLPDGRTFTSDDLTGPQGPQGIAGQDGEDGFSPTVSVTEVTGGHEVSITDAEGTQTFDVMDGVDGQDGQDGSDGADGEDGFSPVVSITDITGGHRISITDAVDTHTADVMDGITPTVEIEDVKVNNASLPIVNKSVNIDLTDYALKSDISSVYKYKGTVNTYAELPSTGLTIGDVYNIETADSQHDIEAGDNVAWTGTAWDKLGGDIDLSSYALKTELPTKVSELTNDSGYITGYTETDPVFTASAAHGITSSDISSWDGKAEISDIPTDLSDLTNDMDVSDFPNDAGYLTSFTETDPTVPSWAKASSKPTYTASEVGAVPTTREVNGKALSSDITLSASDVSALPSNTPIPSKTSDLQNDSGFITGYTETDPVFSASAAYGIAASDITTWNGKSDFSGSYNDLTDKPTIPTVNNGQLTIQRNGTTVDTFTANASSNVTVNISASKVIKVTASSVSSLPLTISNAAITTDMEVVHAVLSNPTAQASVWDWDTNTAGQITISGTIRRTTDITLYLAEI